MRPLLQVQTTRCLYVPMRDGVELAVDIIRPKRDGRYPGVVLRTPYGRRADHEALASRGYAVLIADARGTGASDGVYTYYNLADGLYDGYNLVEWLAGQSFCDGRVGMIGGSALGIYQIITAGTRPPHLSCLAPAAYPLDFYADQWYPGGVFRLQNRLSWIAWLRQRTSPDAVYDEKPSPAAAIAEASAEKRRDIYRRRWLRHERARRAGEDPDAWARPFLDNPVRTAVWEAIDLTPHVKMANAPALHTAVYYDHFGVGTMRGFSLYGGDKRLVLVPGSHGVAGEEKDFGSRLEDDWLDQHLGAAEHRAAIDFGVLAYATGAERWFSWATLPGAALRSLYLSTAGGLEAAPLPAGGSDLPCDPRDPAASFSDDGFADFQRQPQVRTFVSAPFEHQTFVFGEPELRLRISTDMPDANLLARFAAVDAAGMARPLNFGARKLSLREDLGRPQLVPRDRPFEVSLRLWTICHVFAPGTRLMLALSCTDYPFFENAPHAGRIHLHVPDCILHLPVLTAEARTIII